jgi:CRISPR system Cascade subunit CasD
MRGLLLRLAGPLQSWGEHSTFGVRDSLPYPTRSGLIGLFAAAMGMPRTASLQCFDALRFVVRVDRPGTPMVDFHTVGGGLPRARTVPTADGKRRPAGTTTIVSNRTYLADAVFVVAATGEDTLVEDVCTALRSPVWAPFLGRRACPPDAPLLIAGPVHDAESLLRAVPLARRAGRNNPQETVDVIWETPPTDSIASRTTINDVAESFAPHSRRYRSRDVYMTPLDVPSSLCAGYGQAYLERLAAFTSGVPR